MDGLCSIRLYFAERAYAAVSSLVILRDYFGCTDFLYLVLIRYNKVLCVLLMLRRSFSFIVNSILLMVVESEQSLIKIINLIKIVKLCIQILSVQ